MEIDGSSIDLNRIYVDKDGWYFIPETKDGLWRVRWVSLEFPAYSAWEDYTIRSGWVKSWKATEFTKDEIESLKLYLEL